MLDYDAILDKLLQKADRKRGVALVKANAELQTINREYTAYYDGAYDAIKAIKEAMPHE